MAEHLCSKERYSSVLLVVGWKLRRDVYIHDCTFHIMNVFYNRYWYMNS